MVEEPVKTPEKSVKKTSHDNVHMAMLSIQGKLKNPVKDTKGVYGKYPKLDAIRDDVVPILASADMYVTQLVQFGDYGPYLKTVLTHAPSQTFIESDAQLFLEKQTPQGMGASITYMRRYALCAMLGIVAEDDDDGQSAEKTKPEPKRELPEYMKQSKKAYELMKAAVVAKDRDKMVAIWNEHQTHLEELRKHAPDQLAKIYSLFDKLPKEETNGKEK